MSSSNTVHAVKRYFDIHLHLTFHLIVRHKNLLGDEKYSIPRKTGRLSSLFVFT